MDHKLNRLRSHVDFLSSLLGGKAEAIPRTYEAYVQKKFLLMKELRNASILKTDDIITNKTGSFHPDLPFFKNIMSGYSGQDLQLETDPSHDFFYAEKGISFFTNSGQSATNAAVLFLYENFPGITFKTTANIYHESEDLLALMKNISGKDNGPKATLIDSVNFDVTAENLDYALADAEWALIDSTCWEMRSQEMDKIFARLKKEKIPALIIRSHVKLDSLGAEYGLLGSIHFLPGKLDEKIILSFTEKIKKKIAITRSSAGLSDLYPFWVKGIFAQLTRERTNDIRANTHFMEKYFQENLKNVGQLRSYPHALFCVLELPIKANVKEQLRKTGKLSDNAFLVCDSFGFDQLNITYVDSPNDPNKCALRFSGSDLSSDELKTSLGLVCNLLHKLYP